MRARLLLAFFGITAFAVLAAAAGLYAFHEVGDRLDVVDTRIPPTLSALELSRSAERIIAAAPALLAATDRTQRDQVKGALAAEVEHLEGRLRELKRAGTQALPLDEIEPVVAALTSRLTTLEELVARRLATSERIQTLRHRVFQANDDMQRLLAPWLEVVGSEVATLAAARENSAAGTGDPMPKLTALIESQRLMRTAQARVAVITDLLAEASTAGQARRLPILVFQLGLALNDLDAIAAGLDPRLRPLFQEQVARLRELATGPDAMAQAREQELLLVEEGEALLAEIGAQSVRLSTAVDRLGSAAKQEIGEAIRDALAVQQLSARALVVVVALSLLTSILIVWLYVGGNIVRRLTALSDGMLAIAGGRLRTPVAVQGDDEIAAMGRVVEVLRQNTLERDALLTEKAQAAAHLEQVVEQRTAELAQSVEELRALGEVSQAVNSTVDLETVLTTIVAKATQLSNTEAGAIYVYDDASRQFQLRTTYGMDAAVIGEIRKHQLRLGETAVGEAAVRGIPIQIPDVQQDPSAPVLDVIVRTGYRALLFVPLLGVDRIVGTLVVRRKQPGEFPPSTVELLQTFATQSVLAIQHARLFEELQDKRRQLEMANRYKSHFLASASHDLRQPLHALNLFVAQLPVHSDPAERDRLIGRINAAVGAMNELFEALLDMSKLEAGLLEAEVTEFPLAHLCKRIETTFAEAARQQGLRLSVVPSTAWVRSDFVLLERILFNLVSNALRYTARGRVVVGVRRRGGQLRIDVCDSGPGIPTDQQRHIFDEFYQLPGGGHRGGLGLGLAIVDRLSRLLDHPLTLASEPGRGTRFSVSVPRVAALRGVSEVPDLPLRPDPLHDKRVAVIDDDPLVLEGMRDILHGWGCQVIAAATEEALQEQIAAHPRRPDLIIADYRLANGRSGLQVIERLHDRLGAAIPALLISGDTAPERLRDASAKGFHLLHKPVSPLRLRALLHQLLSPRGAS